MEKLMLLILWLVFGVVVIGFGLKFILPVIENLINKRHEYRMRKLELDYNANKDEEYDYLATKIEETQNKLNAVEKKLDNLNTQSLGSLDVKEEFEGILERLEKLETKIDNREKIEKLANTIQTKFGEENKKAIENINKSKFTDENSDY